MPENQCCPQCRRPLPADAPQGICPSCVIGLGINQPPPGNRHVEVSTALGKSFVAPSPEALARRFPGLEIQQLIGHGGMGAVYRARQTNLDRVVALKILSPQLSNDATFAERFTREARTLARLTHPNIVMVFEFGQADNLYYLLMEYVDGVNLRDAIRGKQMSPSEALAIVPQVCEALQYAHDEGIIHRDIKPENILLDKKGRVKIADFGLAKLLGGPEDFTLTGTRQVVGTRNYMAPEQIERPTTVDHRADIYSLGVVFYELLTGELPIGRFAVPSEKAPVDGKLDDVVLRTLEKEPNRRFQQASEVKTAVESLGAIPPRYEYMVARAHGVKQAVESRQPNPPPTTGPAVAARRATRLPFTVSELHAGFAIAYGIARCEPKSLELEFEVRDDVFGAIKSGTQRVAVPYETLCAVRYGRSMFKDHIEMQADSLDSVKRVPGNKHGRFSLEIKRKDRQMAARFVSELNRYVPPSCEVIAPCQPLSSSSAELVSEAQHRLRGPACGLIAAGIIDLLMGVCFVPLMLFAGLFLISSRQSAPISSPSLAGAIWQTSVEAVDFAPAVNSGGMPLGVYLASITLVSAVSVGVGVMLVLGGNKMRQAQSFPFCVAANVMAVLPIHPAVLLGLPFGIWGMVGLGNPATRQAFRLNVVAAAENSINLSHPAAGILAAGVFDVVLAFCCVAVLAYLFAGQLGVGALMLLMFAGASVLCGGLLIATSIKMRAHENVGFCTAGAILAMVPVHPGSVLGLPFGLWALIALASGEVRERFENPAPGKPGPAGKHPAPTAAFSHSRAGANWWLWAVLVFVLTMVCMSMAYYFAGFTRTTISPGRTNAEFPPAPSSPVAPPDLLQTDPQR